MSTPQTIALPAPRLQIRQATLLTSLGLLIATAASILILALTSTSHTTATTPATGFRATSVSVPQIRYLGPQQLRAALKEQTTQTAAGGSSSTAEAKNALLHYCLGAAQRCLR
jgi:hypothetical protein